MREHNYPWRDTKMHRTITMRQAEKNNDRVLIGLNDLIKKSEEDIINLRVENNTKPSIKCLEDLIEAKTRKINLNQEHYRLTTLQGILKNMINGTQYETTRVTFFGYNRSYPQTKTAQKTLEKAMRVQFFTYSQNQYARFKGFMESEFITILTIAKTEVGDTTDFVAYGEKTKSKYNTKKNREKPEDDLTGLHTELEKMQSAEKTDQKIKDQEVLDRKDSEITQLKQKNNRFITTLVAHDEHRIQKVNFLKTVREKINEMTKEQMQDVMLKYIEDQLKFDPSKGLRNAGIFLSPKQIQTITLMKDTITLTCKKQLPHFLKFTHLADEEAIKSSRKESLKFYSKEIMPTKMKIESDSIKKYEKIAMALLESPQKTVNLLKQYYETEDYSDETKKEYAQLLTSDKFKSIVPYTMVLLKRVKDAFPSTADPSNPDLERNLAKRVRAAFKQNHESTEKPQNQKQEWTSEKEETAENMGKENHDSASEYEMKM